MITEGKIVLFKFYDTTQQEGKLRPSLVLKALPSKFDDWLVCMISSQLHHFIPDFDEIIGYDDIDFKDSGLKMPSLIRTSRLAVIDGNIIVGGLGNIGEERLARLKLNLCNWIKDKSQNIMKG